MRIAVVGSGIAGLVSAWLLSREHEVVLFEANDYLGGHTHTHQIELGERSYAVDSGFIVFNPHNYPLLSQLFRELGVVSQPTTMSFAVNHQASGLEYNASSFDQLFSQRRNLLSPRFIGMVRDILRFYREAPAVLDGAEPGPSLGEYLRQERYGAAFRDDHLVPMASALWSSPADDILAFPLRYLVQFMANHQMLQLGDRPEWRVVSGGSRQYVEAIRQHWSVRERPLCPLRSIERDEDGVLLHSYFGVERFDHVVLACHSDQALALLAEPSDGEREILGAIRYQANHTVLHTDTRLLPRRRKNWAAWNAWIPATPGAPCSVTYCMNLLQSIQAPETFCVSLNSEQRIDPSKVLARMNYHHPIYDHAAVAAQGRRAQIQGLHRVWYAGAYWGWGFHEDGIRSAVELAQAFGVHWP